MANPICCGKWSINSAKVPLLKSNADIANKGKREEKGTSPMFHDSTTSSWNFSVRLLAVAANETANGGRRSHV